MLIFLNFYAKSPQTLSFALDPTIISRGVYTLQKVLQSQPIRITFFVSPHFSQKVVKRRFNLINLISYKEQYMEHKQIKKNQYNFYYFIICNCF